MRDQSENRLSVVHLIDAAGGNEQLWGKERVVLWLAGAQLATGTVRPRVWTLTPKLLTEAAAKQGIESESLDRKVTKNLLHYAWILRRRLATIEPAIVHSHGYKANLVARLARGIGASMLGLVSTCHGWVETSLSLRMYNALDRGTSRFSDVVTVPSASMLARLPRIAVTLPNGIPDAAEDGHGRREELRRRYGFGDDQVVAGVLGRLSPEKGIDELIEAARLTRANDRLVWAAAGTGPLQERLASATGALPNLRHVGYVDGSGDFLPAIDLFVQPSRSEGLSLAFLEACRAGLPIVATKVGATESVVRDDLEAILIPPNDAQRLAQETTRLAGEDALRVRLGRQARMRFEEAFDIAVMVQRTLEIYRRLASEPQAPANEGNSVLSSAKGSIR